MKIKHGYKVVRRRKRLLYGYDLISSVIGHIKYKVDHWVYPKKKWGPLAVFQTLDTARYFANEMGGLIYQCLYEPSDKAMLHTRYGTTSESPWEGKALAKRVMLIEFVEGW